MLPIGDDLGRRGFLPGTLVLLVVMVGLEVVLLRTESDRRAGLQAVFALQTARFGTGWWQWEQWASWRRLATVPGHTLMQATLVQAIAVLPFLLVFGGRLEARAGTWRYLVFLLLAASISGAAMVLLRAQPGTMLLGGNALVTACMVACLCFHRRQRVVFVVPVVVVPVIVRLPLVYTVVAWVLFQIPLVQSALRSGGARPTGWQAHLGALLAGAVVGPLLLRRTVRDARPRRTA